MAAAIFRELSDSVQETLGALGRYALFGLRVAAETPRALLRFRLVVEQVHNAGTLSLVIIMLSGLFVGCGLGCFSYPMTYTSMAVYDVPVDNFYLSTYPLEELPGERALEKVLRMEGLERRVMFSSNHPYQEYGDAFEMVASLPEEMRQRVMVDNALALYGERLA